jgi:hypothetical protein
MDLHHERLELLDEAKVLDDVLRGDHLERSVTEWQTTRGEVDINVGARKVDVEPTRHTAPSGTEVQPGRDLPAACHGIEHPLRTTARLESLNVMSRGIDRGVELVPDQPGDRTPDYWCEHSPHSTPPPRLAPIPLLPLGAPHVRSFERPDATEH